MEKQKTICEVCQGEFINIGSHMKAHDGISIKPKEQTIPSPISSATPNPVPPIPSNTHNPVPPIPSTTTTLLNTSGQQVSQEDYFFKGVVQPGFTKYFGKPVDREDMLAVFNRVFKPTDNFLFYKLLDKEVYIIIVPIKYSTTISEANNSLDGDFQKHAISFINEGSVNLDTLKMKLDRIVKFCKFDNR